MREARQQVDRLTAGHVDRSDFFVDKLAQGVGTIAAAFYPKDVIVRLSDFKTNGTTAGSSAAAGSNRSRKTR